MDNLLLNHLVLVDDLASTCDVSAKFEVVVDLIIDIVILLMHHVSNVGVALEFVAELICVIITAEAATIVTDDGLLKPNLVLDAHLGKCEENGADALAEARKQLVRRDVKRNAKLPQLTDDILRGVHRVVILVPAGGLMIV